MIMANRNPSSRTNQERTDATRTALILAAKALFAAKGYGSTSTPEVAEAAGVTRGALYHHFANKQDLFFATACHTAQEVAEAIDKRAVDAATPLDALLLGARGYFDAMSQLGHARMLLVEAPSVLDQSQMEELSARSGEKQLEAGLLAAIPSLDSAQVSSRVLTELVSALFDRAALAIAQNQSADAFKHAVEYCLRMLCADSAR
jgi:AcrR family transcriptional regulator